MLLFYTETVIVSFFQEGNTPFYCAAKGGHYETADILLKHGADIVITDKVSCIPYKR